MRYTKEILEKLSQLGITTAGELGELDNLLRAGNSFQGALIIMLDNRA